MTKKKKQDDSLPSNGLIIQEKKSSDSKNPSNSLISSGANLQNEETNNNNTKTKSIRIQKDQSNFEGFGFSQALLTTLIDKGYKEPHQYKRPLSLN